jgi:hypothetical protein
MSQVKSTSGLLGREHAEFPRQIRRGSVLDTPIPLVRVEKRMAEEELWPWLVTCRTEGRERNLRLS